jgi:hypothetical protein
MKAPRWVLFLLVLPGLLVAVVLGALFFFALALFPPIVSTVALCFMAVFALWLFMRKRSSGPVSESSLMGGTKMSKEGLL